VPDSLLYSWGSCKNGKLGISNNYYTDLAEGDLHSQFYLDDEIDIEASNKYMEEHNLTANN